jgi:outer membrane protein OmpA-like peptidoglycan-associated protein
MNNRLGIWALVVALLVGLTGCAANTDRDKTMKGAGIGAVLGAASGAIIGYQSDKRSGAVRGALIGGAAGGALGAGVGAYMDKQENEFEQQLANERAQNQIEIERQQNEILKLTMSSEVGFDFDSATIKPSFYSSLNKIADIMNRYPQTDIAVVGHTDSVGNPDYNLQLSLRRANAVADYLMTQGVARSRLSTEGRGQLEPIASNQTAAGRAENRRVEIYVIPN